MYAESVPERGEAGELEGSGRGRKFKKRPTLRALAHSLSPKPRHGSDHAQSPRSASPETGTTRHVHPPVHTERAGALRGPSSGSDSAGRARTKSESRASSPDESGGSAICLAMAVYSLGERSSLPRRRVVRGTTRPWSARLVTHNHRACVQRRRARRQRRDTHRERTTSRTAPCSRRPASR